MCGSRSIRGSKENWGRANKKTQKCKANQNAKKSEFNHMRPNRAVEADHRANLCGQRMAVPLFWEVDWKPMKRLTLFCSDCAWDTNTYSMKIMASILNVRYRSVRPWPPPPKPARKRGEYGSLSMTLWQIEAPWVPDPTTTSLFLDTPVDSPTLWSCPSVFLSLFSIKVFNLDGVCRVSDITERWYKVAQARHYYAALISLTQRK
jgi:hypothetical protein